jgi:hypothetical protein
MSKFVKSIIVIVVVFAVILLLGWFIAGGLYWVTGTRKSDIVSRLIYIGFSFLGSFFAIACGVYKVDM